MPITIETMLATSAAKFKTTPGYIPKKPVKQATMKAIWPVNQIEQINPTTLNLAVRIEIIAIKTVARTSAEILLTNMPALGDTLLKLSS